MDSQFWRSQQIGSQQALNMNELLTEANGEFGFDFKHEKKLFVSQEGGGCTLTISIHFIVENKHQKIDTLTIFDLAAEEKEEFEPEPVEATKV